MRGTVATRPFFNFQFSIFNSRSGNCAILPTATEVPLNRRFFQLIAALLLLGGGILVGRLQHEAPAQASPSQPAATAARPAPQQTAPAADGQAKTESRYRLEQVPAGEERELVAETLRLIDAGGPFANRKDGSTFQNREGRLPAKPRDYYREYTVPTPESRDRGARRIVRGSGGDTWYTRDHYRTFVRVDGE